MTGDDQEGWPSKNRSKGQGKDFQSGGRYGRKGGQKGGKEELLSRISRTHCKLCGVMGHWKAECPQRREQAREQANVVQPDGHHDDDLPQVIVEEMDEAQSVTCHAAECFHAPKQNSKGIPEPVRVQAVQFLSRRMSSHWLNGKPMGINKRDTWGNRGKRGYKVGKTSETLPGSPGQSQCCQPSPVMQHASPAKYAKRVDKRPDWRS